MARGLERPPIWAIVALVISAITLIVLYPLATNREGEHLPQAEIDRMNAASAAFDAEQEAARPRRVAFVGDSYTGGSDEDSGEAFRWPALIGPELNWTPEYFAVGGSGYLAPGQDQPFSERIDDVIASGPDIVVVAGGINDAQRYPAADIGAAALDVFQRLRAGLPDAEIVVVGTFFPRWPEDDPTVAAARDAIQQAAAAVPGTAWIDPLPWFENGGVEISSDRTHPTDAGHQAIATNMTAALRQLGFGPPG